MTDARPKEATQLREFWERFKLPRKYRSKLRSLIEPELHRKEGVDRRKLTTEVIDLLELATDRLKFNDHAERTRATPAQKIITSKAALEDGSLINSEQVDWDTNETMVGIAEEIIFTRTNKVPDRRSVISELQKTPALRAEVHARLLEQCSDGRPATEAGPLLAAKVAEILFHAGIEPTVSAARDTFRSPNSFFKNPTKSTSSGESLYVGILRVLFEAAEFNQVGTLIGIASEGIKLARLDALKEDSRDLEIINQ
jgi:hypothetical protein